MLNHYSLCNFCPRSCGVNRTAGETGYCGETADLRVGVAAIYRGEEPPLIGKGGSGTIFISGCNLGCVYCQIYQISQGEKNKGTTLGKVVSTDEFAKICVSLRDKGAENINIVTGSHVVPAIIEGLNAARKAGVQIPILWNSSGYESLQSIEMLKDHIDIYMPDLKTIDTQIATKFFNAPDYPAVATSAILKMIDNIEQRSQFSENNFSLSNKKSTELKSNLIIRHLILPDHLESTYNVLKWFADNVKTKALLSLMTQYTPIPGREEKAPTRYVNKSEFEIVMKWLDEFGITDGFCQEVLTETEWLPDFKKKNPFPAEIALPVWTML
jgi:putative pyruvate formate lyase activating enzyme